MILVFGTICIDRIRRIDHWPRRGGYAEIRSDVPFLGGEAANTASHLARWGADVTLIGNALGLGERASHLRQLLAAHHLSDADLHDGGSTPICDVYLTPDGERTMLGHGFSHMTLPLSLDSTPWRPGGWFTTDPNFGAPAREALARAHSEGMRTYAMDFFQPTDVIPAGSHWQSSTDWVGVSGDSAANLRFVEDWVARHGCFAILTDAANGCWYGGPGLRTRHFAGPHATQVVDATGAGDAFRAGMLYGLDRDWSVEERIAFASAAGALKCAFLGGSSATFTVADALAFARQA